MSNVSRSCQFAVFHTEVTEGIGVASSVQTRSRTRAFFVNESSVYETQKRSPLWFGHYE